MDSNPVPSSGLVVMVFTDLVDSTLIKAHLPGPDLEARNRDYATGILARHRERVERDLAAQGGRVVKREADGYFLAFSNAVRAARWAAALQAGHAEDPIDTPLGPLQVRIGIHAGTPLVDPLDAEDYLGHEVDYAARIAALAGGDQIVLSETMAALVRDARVAGFRLQAHGEHELKGIGRVPVFELLHGEKQPRPLRGAPARETSDSSDSEDLSGAPLFPYGRAALVSRDAEVADLRSRLCSVLEGRGGTILLAGEPGIGKTRLAQEISQEARQRGFHVLAGHCDEQVTAPYQPFALALLEYLNAAAPAQLARALPPAVACELARIVPDVTARLRDVPGAAALPAEHGQLALMEAVRQFLAAVGSSDAPVLLVLDDLHWADEGSLALLHYLSRAAGGMRLLIVGAYRDVELSTRHPLEQTLTLMNRERLYQRLLLRRLPRASVERLVDALLPGWEPDPAFLVTLHRETEGNPFFIEEVLKHLVEEGAIYRGEGRWQIRSAEHVRVPESIRATIGRRVQRLPEESQETLRLAAVIGQQFSFDLLLEVSGLPEDRLLEMVEEWLAAHLVVEQRQGRDELYRFHHALIRETLYEELSLRRGARLHERVGAALEAVYGAQTDAHLDALAYHFSHSHSGDAAEKGIDYCLRAGQRALLLNANEEAIRHFTAALELLDGFPEDEARLRRRWELVYGFQRAHRSRGDRERARAVLQDYLRRAEALPFPWGMAAAHHELGWTYWTRPEGMEHFETCLALGEQHGMGEWTARARIQLGEILGWIHPERDFDRASALLRATLAAPEGLTRGEVEAAYCVLMLSCAVHGRWEEAIRAFHESLAVGGPRESGVFLFFLSAMERVYFDEGRHDEYLAFCREARRLLAEAGTGIAHNEGYVQPVRGTCTWSPESDISDLSLNQWYLEPAQPSAQFTRELFLDSFDAPELKPSWEWHDPGGASSFSLSERSGALTLHAAGGVDLFPLFNLNAPRLLLEVRGDFALETRVEGNWDERQAGAGGLLVWKDTLNFLRLDKFCRTLRHNEDIILAARVRGEFLHFGRGRLRGRVYHLRLERVGDRFTSFASTDGVHWLTAGWADLPVADPL
jgi:class 3 adenylate cyclase/tetratricopeptide (TPR) repeat protein